MKMPIMILFVKVNANSGYCVCVDGSLEGPAVMVIVSLHACVFGLISNISDVLKSCF
jgi:hypothetical protein